jgi:hypothetical protein
VTKAAFNKTTNFTSNWDLNLRTKPVKRHIWSIVFHGAETWTLREVDRKYLEGLELCCWKRMDKINWTNNVKNEEVLRGVEEERNILQPYMEVIWIDHILRRNCLKHVTDGIIEERSDRNTRKKT